jgi:hypothetical protein
MSFEITGMVCFIACASGHLGDELGGDGLYGGLGFGGGIVLGFSPSLAVRSGVEPGWGTTFDCFAAVGPVGVRGSVPISDGSPGVTFSPGVGGGCYFVTSYTWD